MRGPVFIEGAKLHELIYGSLDYPPIDLGNPPSAPGNRELTWLYVVRENAQGVVATPPRASRLYVVFTNGQVPFHGEPRYDLNYWNFAHYV